MKLIKPLIQFFFLTAILLSGCKTNSTKDKLARTWVMEDMSGPGAARFPDSVKREMYGTRYLEFTDEGEMIATGGKARMQRGDYHISSDGKTIFTTVNGRASDTMAINKLTKDTLILLIKKANLEITWTPK